MKRGRIILILICISVLLMMTPIYADTVTAQVDDKGLMYVYQTGVVGTLHTQYGWIIVDDTDYNQITVNDTIRYDTHKDTFWGLFWNVEVVR